MDFIDKNILAYAEEHTSDTNKVLTELTRKTNTGFVNPRMLSGHLQGQFLKMISCLVQPKNILEIGTFTGYSAICLAEGLQKNGKLFTLDIDPEIEDTAKLFFKKSGFSKSIIMMLGNALEIIPSLKTRFQLVFIDADKENYCKYYQLVFPLVETGGIIMADNALWGGKVLDANEIKRDKETAGIVAFNKMIKKDMRVQKLLLPIRDGIMMIRKIR